MNATEFHEFEVAISNADRTAITERIKVNIPVRWDGADWVLTEEAHRIIDDTKRAKGVKGWRP